MKGIQFYFAGINEKGFIVERPGKAVKHISGRQILDNHSVNLLSSIIIALSLPRIANLIWPWIFILSINWFVQNISLQNQTIDIKNILIYFLIFYKKNIKIKKKKRSTNLKNWLFTIEAYMCKYRAYNFYFCIIFQLANYERSIMPLKDEFEKLIYIKFYWSMIWCVLQFFRYKKIK